MECVCRDLLVRDSGVGQGAVYVGKGWGEKDLR